MKKIKASRDINKERSSTGYAWADSFFNNYSKQLNKEAEPDFLKEYLNKNVKPIEKKKWNSIEEKLADIKKRVGFDLVNKTVNEIEKISTASSSCGLNKDKCSCGCSPKSASKHLNKKASLNADERKIVMKNTLDFINQIINFNSEITASEVIAKCLAEEKLLFESIESHVDFSKLKEYISELINSKNKKTIESVRYVPSESLDIQFEDDIAEYYKHSDPST
jgi:hypothetical protein